jgi:hypothetical protein
MERPPLVDIAMWVTKDRPSNDKLINGSPKDAQSSLDLGLSRFSCRIQHRNKNGIKEV